MHPTRHHRGCTHHGIIGDAHITASSGKHIRHTSRHHRGSTQHGIIGEVLIIGPKGIIRVDDIIGLDNFIGADDIIGADSKPSQQGYKKNLKTTPTNSIKFS